MKESFDQGDIERRAGPWAGRVPVMAGFLNCQEIIKRLLEIFVRVLVMAVVAGQE